MSKLEDASTTKFTIGQAKHEEGYTYSDIVKMNQELLSGLAHNEDAMISKYEKLKAEQRQDITSSPKFKNFIASKSSGILSINGNTSTDLDDSILALGLQTWIYIANETTAFGAFHHYEQRNDEDEIERSTSILLAELAILMGRVSEEERDSNSFY